MVARVSTVAFVGVDVTEVEVQVHVAPGLPAFTIVGLPNKAVGESRDRVRAALSAIGLALPAKRVTINLAPADQLKEGSHFDLPIAVGLLVAMGALPAEEMADYVVLGEVGLDGGLAPVAGVLPAAVHANALGKGLICPAAQGGEAAWAGSEGVLAPSSLLALVNHFKGVQVLGRPEARRAEAGAAYLDLRDIKGQETAKRALEVVAAGGHNMLLVGPPGAGKSMLAARLPGILPPLTTREALDVSMIHSIAGALPEGGLLYHRPFRDPHHSASVPALVGGGLKTRPGEISLAHNGVLFLDELPEFARAALEALRQPLETGRVSVARANTHVTYPARVQLIAAMNPCPCGYLDDESLACNKAPKCAQDYVAKLSGPLLDRIDIHVEAPAVNPADLSLPPPSEGSAQIAVRVARARAIQAERYRETDFLTNAQADGELLEAVAAPDDAGRALLTEAAERMRLSARGYHRILRVARTLADLDGSATVSKLHVAEALSYRRAMPGRSRMSGRSPHAAM